MLGIKPEGSDKLLYEDFSHVSFSVPKWRRECKLVSEVANVEAVPRGHRGIKHYISEVFTVWQPESRHQSSRMSHRERSTGQVMDALISQSGLSSKLPLVSG